MCIFNVHTDLYTHTFIYPYTLNYTRTIQVKRRLNRLRAACEAMGVQDSMLLPKGEQVTAEERREIKRAMAALDRGKADKDHDLRFEEGEGEREGRRLLRR